MYSVYAMLFHYVKGKSFTHSVKYLGMPIINYEGTCRENFKNALNEK